LGFISKITTYFSKDNAKNNASDSQIHFAQGVDFHIDPKRISRNVRKIVTRLNQANYEAYLVGGGVRDLLLDKEPKDFDIATSATPEQVRHEFRNCRIIGRRFKLAHVYFKDEIIEVATFRSNHEKQTDAHVSDHGMVLRDNVYGNLEDDSWRRDFTINALYYDLIRDTIIDHTGGLEDIEHNTLRIIGDASQRYREDPVRMLRAMRFAAKLDFDFDPDTQAPFPELKTLLENVSSARLFEETLKLFFTGHAQATFEVLNQYGFFDLLLPQTAKALEKSPEFAEMLKQALINTDERIYQGKSINPAFLLAVLLWGPFQNELKLQKREEKKSFIAQQNAMNKVLAEQQNSIAIPRRFSQMIREIWELQYRLPKRYGKRAKLSFENKRFRAAYDFLLLRAIPEPQWQELADWWTEYQEVPHEKREEMVAALTPKPRVTQDPTP
jgi:poly(A) polymerase